MRGRRSIILFCALAASAVVAVPAQAGLSEDFAAVYRAWGDTAGIPHCRFTKQQLVNARDAARAVQDFGTYSPSFPGDVDTEIRFMNRGGCRGVARPPSKRKLAKSALRTLRIGKIRPRGRESVVLKNAGRRTVNLAGATLRDRSGHRIRLRGTLGPHQARRFFSRGVWDNAGDVVKLTDRRGLVVRQTGFGSWAGCIRF